MKKDLNYYKENCEEDYITTPISVLRYITQLEAGYNHAQTEIEQLKKDKEELVEALKKCQDAFRENLKKWNYKNEELMFNTLQNNKQLITKHNG
jgi:predicted nuclease with TOPRIM domain